jgi:hypothetical protein
MAKNEDAAAGCMWAVLGILILLRAALICGMGWLVHQWM